MGGEAGEGAGKRSTGRVLRLVSVQVAFALGSFLCASAFVRAALPRPVASDLGVKLDRLEELAAEVDTVFIGSSVVHCQVDPALFDRVTAELGRPTHSFNLGARMMSTLEAGYALRRLLALRAPKLERVFLECRHMGVSVGGDDHLTLRFSGWHDARATLAAVRLALASERGPGRRLELALLHAGGFGRRLANLGLARVALGQELGLGAAEGARRRAFLLGPRGDGYAPLDWAHAQETRTFEEALARGIAPPERDLEARRLLFASQRPNFELRVLELRSAKDTAEPTSGEVAVYRELVRAAEGAGLEVVFFSNPDVIHPEREVAERGALLRALARTGVLPRLIDLGDPDELPELFDADRRFDWSHLDSIGAERLTRELAVRWARG